MHENPPSTMEAQSLGTGPAVAWQAAGLPGSRTMCPHSVAWGLRCLPARACLGTGILAGDAASWRIMCLTQMKALCSFLQPRVRLYFSGFSGMWETSSVGLCEISLCLLSSGVTVTPVYTAHFVALLFLEMISLGFVY